MYHWKNGWYFGRRGNGSVRVVKLQRHPDMAFMSAEAEYKGAEVDLTIPESEWCSLVASLTVSGETSVTISLARSLHAI